MTGRFTAKPETRFVDRPPSFNAKRPGEIPQSRGKKRCRARSRSALCDDPAPLAGPARDTQKLASRWHKRDAGAWRRHRWSRLSRGAHKNRNSDSDLVIHCPLAPRYAHLQKPAPSDALPAVRQWANCGSFSASNFGAVCCCRTPYSRHYERCATELLPRQILSLFPFDFQQTCRCSAQRFRRPIVNYLLIYLL